MASDIQEARGNRKRIYAGLALAVLAAASAGYAAWRAWFAQANGAEQFASAVVQRGDLEDTVTATGTLQPRDYVDVGTQVSGQLKKLHVDIGARVKAGQLLAEIDPTLYQSRVDADRAQLANLQAQLADKQSQLALAEQQYRRQTNMMREEATTQEALQTAEAALRSTRAQIDAVKAQIQQTSSTLRGDEANLAYARIYAPMSGTVVSQNAKQGQTLNANQQAPIVLRIADLSTMTIDAQVSEADVPKLALGMDVYFTTIGNQAQRWYGRLRQINPTPQVVNNVVLYDALFDVPNPGRALMTQMTAQVFFVVAQAKDAVLVPLSALKPAGGDGKGQGRRRLVPSGAATSPAAAAIDPRTQFANGRAVVRLVEQDGTIREREVRIGVMNRVAAQVLSGLEPGERVVVRGAGPGPRPSSAATTPTPRFPPRL